MAEPAFPDGVSVVLTNLNKLLPDIEALYKDIHAHPELSMQETRTANLAAEKLNAATTCMLPGWSARQRCCRLNCVFRPTLATRISGRK
jgi:hypothetical protein